MYRLIISKFIAIFMRYHWDPVPNMKGKLEYLQIDMDQLSNV